MGTFNYARACMFYILDKGGPLALMWGQAALQIRLIVGSILSFVLVSVNVFQAEPPCPGM